MSLITIISGSTRKNSQSGKIARYIQDRLPNTDVEIMDLSETHIEPWSERYWDPNDAPCKNWPMVSARFAASDAFVIIAPEWNGMAPPALMNLFLIATGGEFSHKPALLVGVSAGVSGTYPIAQLRVFGPKNTQLVYIPDHVIVRDANNVLNGPDSAGDPDTRLRARIDYSLKMLETYATAFVGIRESGVIDRKSYPFGM